MRVLGAPMPLQKSAKPVEISFERNRYLWSQGVSIIGSPAWLETASGAVRHSPSGLVLGLHLIDGLLPKSVETVAELVRTRAVSDYIMLRSWPYRKG